VTETEAKELIISQMNYIAYREFDHSLFPSDRDRLFGAEHYQLEPHTFLPDTPSLWAPGQDLEAKMPELLTFAVISSEEGQKNRFRIALDLVRLEDGYLNQVIQSAERELSFFPDYYRQDGSRFNKFKAVWRGAITWLQNLRALFNIKG